MKTHFWLLMLAFVTALPLPARAAEPNLPYVDCVSDAILAEMRKVKSAEEVNPLWQKLAKRSNPVYRQCPKGDTDSFIGAFCVMVHSFDHVRMMQGEPALQKLDAALKSQSMAALEKSDACLEAAKAPANAQAMMNACEKEVRLDAQRILHLGQELDVSKDDSIKYVRMSVQEVYMWRLCRANKALFAE